MRRKTTGTSLFLMEMLMVILFFSLAAAVCMRVFAAARLASDYSSDLSAAASRAENAAEYFKTCGGDTADIAYVFEAAPAPDGFTAYYDADWQLCGEADAAFTLSLTADGLDANIDVRYADGSELYALEAVALASGWNGGGE